MPTLTLPSGNIYYQQSGSGPDLVLLHNGFESSRTWDRVLPELKKTHRVTSYDRAGFGRSALVTPQGDIIALGVAELDQVLTELGIEEAILIGHCLGAAIALSFAASFPQRVRGLVAEACGFFGDAETIQKCTSVFRPWEKLPPRIKQSLKAMHGETRAEPFWRGSCNYTGGYVMHQDYDLRPRLRLVTCPVLVMTGEEDFFFTPEHTESGANAIPKAKLHLLPEIGHDVHRDHPALWLELVQSLTDELA